VSFSFELFLGRGLQEHAVSEEQMRRISRVGDPLDEEHDGLVLLFRPEADNVLMLRLAVNAVEVELNANSVNHGLPWRWIRPLA